MIDILRALCYNVGNMRRVGRHSSEAGSFVDSVERPKEHENPRQRMKRIGALAAAAAFLASGVAEEVDNHEPTPPQNLQLMVVDAENSDKPRTSSEQLDEMTSEVREAAEIMNQNQDAVQFYSEDPKSFVVANNGECISDETVEKIVEVERKMGNEALWLFVSGNTEYCPIVDSEVPVAAFAVTAGDGRGYTTYSSGGLRDAVVAHEIGHVFGFGHRGRVGCDIEFDERGNYEGQLREVREIVECGPEYTNYGQTEEVDWYASDESVMGYVDSRVLFDSVEKHHLDPEMYPIKLINPSRSADYPVSNEPGKDHGIKISLPEDHPLKELKGRRDTEPEAIVFAINTIEDSAEPCDINDSVRCRLTASVVGLHGNDMYDIDLTNDYIGIGRDVDHEKGTEAWVYTDETLGIAVMYDDGQGIIRVAQLDDPGVRESIEQQHQDAAAFRRAHQPSD